MIDDISNVRILTPSGAHGALGQLCDVKIEDGASMIYREANSRYIAIKYSVRGRDLGGAIEGAMNKVNQKVKLPTGYHLDWAGEYVPEHGRTPCGARGEGAPAPGIRYTRSCTSSTKLSRLARWCFGRGLRTLPTA
jgi:hypothetical protein